MEHRSWASSVASAAFFGRATLVGFGEIWLCPSMLAGAAMLAATSMLSPRAAVLAAVGGATASGWALFTQRDARLVAAGWYGTNGALAGLWISSLVMDPGGAALATVAGALAVAWLLDVVVFPLGDAPLGLPPLSLPFVVVALVGTLALPLAREAVERLAGRAHATPTAAAAVAWQPRATPSALRDEVAAGWSAWRRGDYERAHAQFSALATVAADLAEAHSGLGWSAFKLGAHDDAARAFGRALALDPHAPSPVDGLAWIAFRRGRHAEAARLFDTARHAAPQWADPHDGLGWSAYMRGRYQEARAHFEQAIALEANHASALSGLGWTALMRDRLEEAGRHFDAATIADPELFLALEGLGWTLARSGRARDAERIFTRAVAAFPHERSAVFGLGDARRRLILSGARPAVDPALEWRAIRRAFPATVAVPVLLVTAAIVIAMPWSGLVAILSVAAGAALGVLIAGPAAFAWFDLHVQTLVPLGLLVGRVTTPSWRHLARAAIVAAGGTGAWAALHLVNVTPPLLAFNLVGLVYLAARRHIDREREEPAWWRGEG